MAALGEYEAVFFVDHEGSQVGYAIFQRQQDALFFAKRHVFLRHFIARSRRRKGVGTQAFQALKEELWEGVDRVDLHVLIKNRRAVDFWHSLGFKEYQFGVALENRG